MNSLLDIKHIFYASLIGTILLLIGHFVVTSFLAIGTGAYSITLVLTAILYIDSKMLGGVNTYEEIVLKKNMAYAAYFCAIVFAVVMAYAIPFIVFVKFQ
jgi:hypothetical protein